MLVQDAVKDALVEALGVDDEEITPNVRLVDLGMESIDILDIQFRLERKLGISKLDWVSEMGDPDRNVDDFTVQDLIQYSQTKLVGSSQHETIIPDREIG